LTGFLARKLQIPKDFESSASAGIYLKKTLKVPSKNTASE